MSKSDVRDLFGRISVASTVLEPFFRKLTMESGIKFLCYEHEADEEISRTHVHFILLGGQRTVTTYKNYITECIKSAMIDFAPRTDWSLKTYEADKADSCVKYMSKGKLDPKMNIGFDDEYLMKMKSEGYDKKDKKDEKIKLEDDKKSDWYYIKKTLEIIYKKKFPDRTIPSMWGVEEANDVEISLDETMEALRKMMRQERKVIGKKKFMDYMFCIQTSYNRGYSNTIVWQNIPFEFNRQVNY